MSALILKLIAAFTMTVDHAGLILFGNETWMRAVGRLAFPLYAYFIAEGFRYTKNRLRYFLTVFLLGVGCQIVCAIAEPGQSLGVLLTFSLSIALMALTDLAKKDRRFAPAVPIAIAGIYVFCHFVWIDYGFFGVILPWFASLFEKKWHRLAAFALGLLLLCGTSALSGNSLQSLSLLSLLLLALYNGQRGKYKMKYFFYIFYPLHLAVIWGLALFF